MNTFVAFAAEEQLKFSVQQGADLASQATQGSSLNSARDLNLKA